MAKKPSFDMAQKQGPMFFKPMISDFSKKLSIPHAFLKYLVGERRDKAILKSLEKSWHVKVGRDKERMWFEEGWADFAKDHDLQVGEFLVFRYDGDMVFDVKIYDRSTCEKEMSLVKKKNKNHGKQRCMEDHVNDFKDTKTIRTKRPLPSDIEENKEHGNKRGKVGKSSSSGVERASSSKAKHPYFTTTIVPSNLIGTTPYMNIPSVFRKANDISEIHQMTLKDPKGRSWPVKVNHRTRGDVFFTSGWTEFSEINGLQVGDVCIFQFTNARMKVMDVRISSGK